MNIAVAGASGTVGRHVVELASSRGHDVRALSRSSGCDLSEQRYLTEFLRGTEVIIDVSNSSAFSYRAASKYFTTSSTTLSQEGARLGARHLVSLSIVGIDKAAAYGYYRAKLEQESCVRNGPLTHSIVRATQFHEFAPQVMARLRVGPICLVPHMKVQTVAARSVAEVLVDVATQQPLASTLEVAGPEIHDLVHLARRYGEVHHGARVLGLPSVGALSKVLASGALLASDHARIVGPNFDEWLRS